MPGADERRVGEQQGYGLALHVRAHQRAVGVVVLEEGDERRRDGHDLHRRDVHVVDAAGGFEGVLEGAAALDALVDELELVVEAGGRLRDDLLVLAVRLEVLDVVRVVGDVGLHGDAALRQCGDALGGGGADAVSGADDGLAVVVEHVLGDGASGEVGGGAGDLLAHGAVGGLDEAVVVEARVRRERAEQSDVRALRRLDGADAPVVGVVHVADVEAGALAGESAGAECGEAALVGELGQRVGLVHELGELGASEELAHRRDDGADVDERARRRLLLVEDGHALLDDALHTEEADAELVHDELADGADAPVAEVVDVVGLGVAVVDADHHPDHLDDVVLGERARLFGDAQAHAVVHLVASDLAEVVAAGVEEEVLQELAGAVDAGGLAGAEPAVDLDEGLRLVRDAEVLVEGGLHVGVVGVGVDLGEEAEQVVVLGVADGAEEGGDGELALAVDLDGDDVARAGLELEPCAAVGDQLGERDVAPGAGVLHAGEVGAGGAHELADDDALGAVDDEGAGGRHHRDVAEEELLLLDLAGLLDLELDGDVEGGLVGALALAALLLGELGVAEDVLAEAELEAVAREVLDGVDLVEHLAEAVALEGLEGLGLDLHQAVGFEHLVDAGVGLEGVYGRAVGAGYEGSHRLASTPHGYASNAQEG